MHEIPFKMTEDGLKEYEVTEAAHFCAATIALMSAHSERAGILCVGMQRSLDLAGKFSRTGALEEDFDENQAWRTALDAAIERHGDGNMLVVANSGIPTLAMLARCIATKKRVWVEDCSFSRRFVAPLCGDNRYFITLVPVTQMLRASRATASGASSGDPCIMVSMLDRWATRRIEYDLIADILNAKFYVSPVDALMALVHPAPFFFDGVNLSELKEHAFRPGEPIPRAKVASLVDILLRGIVRMIVEQPALYLGSAALISRSLRWRRDEARECEAIITAVFRSCLGNSDLLDADSTIRIRKILASR